LLWKFTVCLYWWLEFDFVCGIVVLWTDTMDTHDTVTFSHNKCV